MPRLLILEPDALSVARLWLRLNSGDKHYKQTHITEGAEAGKDYNP